MYDKKVRFLVYAFLSIVNLNRVVAQDIWTDNRHKKTVSLEILKANEDRIDPTFSKQAAFLTGKCPLTRKTRIIAQVPFSYYETRTAIGNPYFGIESPFNNSALTAELGLRVPLLDEIHGLAGSVGRDVDRIDRYEAFATKGTTVSGALHYASQNNSGLILKLHAGSIFWFASQELDLNQLFLVFSAQTGYRFQRCHILAGTSGRYRIPVNSAGQSESVLYQIGLALEIYFGKFQPGIIFRLPLNNEKTHTDFVLGLVLGINIE